MVAHRVGASAREFREIFTSVEECFTAAFDEGLGRVSQAVKRAVLPEQHWLDRVRASLVALLGFVGDEPAWGRFLLLPAPVAPALALDCEQRAIAAVMALVNDDCHVALNGEPTSPPEDLIGELVIGGIFAVIRTRMLSAVTGRSWSSHRH